MALHLNLYHEIQKQEIQRQRDPLKLGLYGLVVVVAILLAYYFYRVEQVQAVASRAAQMQTRWQMTDPKAKDAQALETQLSASIKIKEDLVQAIETRFYWAPLLERIQKMVPPNIQITSFRGGMGPWGEAPGTLRRTREGALTVNGIASGIEPRKAAEDFRTGFCEKCLQGYSGVDGNFASLEDSEATVQLDGKPLRTSLFSLVFKFTVNGPEPAPTPVQRVQKGARQP